VARRPPCPERARQLWWSASERTSSHRERRRCVSRRHGVGQRRVEASCEGVHLGCPLLEANLEEPVADSDMGRTHALCSGHTPSDVSQGRACCPTWQSVSSCGQCPMWYTDVFRASVRRKGPLSDNAWPTYGQCSGNNEAGVPSPTSISLGRKALVFSHVPAE